MRFRKTRPWMDSPSPMACRAACACRCPGLAAEMPLEMEIAEKIMEPLAGSGSQPPCRPPRTPQDEEAAKRLYQKPDDTKEWAENNYRNLLPGQQDASLLVGPPPSAGVRALRRCCKPFLSATPFWPAAAKGSP
ncbi:MAG: hypothetical protein U1F77_01570 [Kiritimatiellia bacterium]